MRREGLGKMPFSLGTAPTSWLTPASIWDLLLSKLTCGGFPWLSSLRSLTCIMGSELQMISQYCFFVSRRVFLIGKGTKVGYGLRDTGSVRLLSGICSHRGHPSHPTLSSWPAFKSPGTYSAFVWFGHFPSLLLTAAYCTSPKTLNICSFPPGWGWRQSLRDFTGCPPPRPLRYLRLCLSRLPSLLSWRGTVHVPVEGYQLCLLKITLVSPTGFPAVPAVCPPSLLFAVHPGKGASPGCSHGFLSSFLQLFAQSLYL